MPNVSSYNALGTSIETSEIQDGQVTHAKLGSDLKAWKLLETITASSSTSETTGTLAAYDEYMVVCRNLEGSGTLQLSGRVNGVSTAVYGTNYLTGAGVATQSAATSMLIGILNASTSDGYIIHCQGKTTGARTILCGHITAMNAAGDNKGGTFQVTIGAATQVSTFTIFMASGNFSGTIEVYGR